MLLFTVYFDINYPLIIKINEKKIKYKNYFFLIFSNIFMNIWSTLSTPKSDYIDKK